ncbi:MAG: hypothetical protein K2X53_00190 [Alphaproteobacteria bacterium]|nr:hypothetical protein [Alphaproteobacteria bacterium]
MKKYATCALALLLTVGSITEGSGAQESIVQKFQRLQKEKEEQEKAEAEAKRKASQSTKKVVVDSSVLAQLGNMTPTKAPPKTATVKKHATVVTDDTSKKVEEETFDTLVQKNKNKPGILWNILASQTYESSKSVPYDGMLKATIIQRDSFCEAIDAIKDSGTVIFDAGFVANIPTLLNTAFIKTDAGIVQGTGAPDGHQKAYRRQLICYYIIAHLGSSSDSATTIQRLKTELSGPDITAQEIEDFYNKIKFHSDSFQDSFPLTAGSLKNRTEPRKEFSTQRKAYLKAEEAKEKPIASNKSTQTGSSSQPQQAQTAEDIKKARLEKEARTKKIKEAAEAEDEKRRLAAVQNSASTSPSPGINTGAPTAPILPQNMMPPPAPKPGLPMLANWDDKMLRDKLSQASYDLFTQKRDIGGTQMSWQEYFKMPKPKRDKMSGITEITKDDIKMK